MTLEERIKSLEERYEKLYNRFYAQNVRREELALKRRISTKAAIRALDSYREMISRLNSVTRNISKGKTLIMLNSKKARKLHYWLNKDLRGKELNKNV